MRKKTSTDSALWFRTPPTVEDFRQKYIVSRRGFANLLRSLRQPSPKIVLIEGHPASGKTTLLYHLAYELTKCRYIVLRPRRVYLLADLKHTQGGELHGLESDFHRLRRGSIVLIDDAHAQLLRIGNITRDPENNDIIFVVATRPLRNYPRDQVALLLDQKAERVEIDARELSSEIVDHYWAAKELSPQGVVIAHGLAEPYRNDLYALVYSLEASKVRDGIPHVSASEIHQHVLESVVSRVEHAGRPVDRSPILAIVAALFRFEAPTAREFLVQELGIPIDDITALIQRGDVLSVMGDDLTLHHSSYASQIVGALSSSTGIRFVPDILRRRADQAGVRWQEEVISWHISAVQSNSISLLVAVARSGPDGRSLALRLLRRHKIPWFVPAIDPLVTSVEQLGSFVELCNSLEEVLPPECIARVETYVQATTEDRVSAWLWAASNMAMCSTKSAELFVDRLEPLLRSQPAEVIANVGVTLSYASKDLAVRALRLVDRRVLLEAQKRSTEDMADFAKIFAKLVWIDEEFAGPGDSIFEVFPSIDADELALLLSRISWGNPSVGKRLIEACDPEDLANLLLNARTPAARYRALAAIATSSIKSAKAIVGSGVMDSLPPQVGLVQLCDRIVDANVGSRAVVHVSSLIISGLTDNAVGAAASSIRLAVTEDGSSEALARYVNDWRNLTDLSNEGELALAFLASDMVSFTEEASTIIREWFERRRVKLGMTSEDAIALLAQMPLAEQDHCA